MDFSKWIRGLGLFTLWMMVGGTLQAATPFQVSTTSLSFGNLKLSDSKTLSFKLQNLQKTPLEVAISKSSTLFSIKPEGKVSLGGNETKDVQVTVVAQLSKCQPVSSQITIAAGLDQFRMPVNVGFLCPDLVVAGGANSTFIGNTIEVTFQPMNVGLADSLPCVGQLYRDGILAETFNIPAFTTSRPGDNKLYAITINNVPRKPTTIEIRVDTNHANSELSEINNVQTTTATLPEGGPDPPS